MSAPRPILPGEVVCVTRRTVVRKLLLRPDGWVGEAFGYLLAVLSAKLDIGVVAGVLMSDHYHLVVIDRAGRLPELTERLDALMAKVVNAGRGRSGSVWDGREPHYEALADPPAVLSMAAYVLANPVAAGLVAAGAEWPGFRTAPQACGTRRRYRRPRLFFARNGRWPAEAELAVVAPPWWSDGRRFVGELAALVGAREAQARRAVREAGRRFSGPRAVLRVSWNDEAASPEARGARRPLVAAATEAVRAAYLGWRREFVTRYREARRRFVAGAWGAVFPRGTWLLWRVFGVAGARPPD